jgi:hypothetical protein
MSVPSRHLAPPSFKPALRDTRSCGRLHASKVAKRYATRLILRLAGGAEVCGFVGDRRTQDRGRMQGGCAAGVLPVRCEPTGEWCARIAQPAGHNIRGTLASSGNLGLRWGRCVPACAGMGSGWLWKMAPSACRDDTGRHVGRRSARQTPPLYRRNPIRPITPSFLTSQ